MERILTAKGRSFWLQALAPGEVMASAFDGEPYAALLWTAVPTSAEHKSILAESLVRGGCRYVVLGGVEAEAWEDAVDEAFIAEIDDIAQIAGRLVMTAIPPEPDTVFFFVHAARLEGTPFPRCVVLLVGGDPALRDELVARIRAEAGPSVC